MLRKPVQDGEELLPVSVVADHRLALVSAVHDVIYRPGMLEAESARHDYCAIDSSEKCQY